MRCRSQTNFLRWQEWSVQFERDSAPPGKFRRLINNATEPQELMAITDDNVGFELHYLGFTEGPYPSMDRTKAEVGKFALPVLDVLKSKIAI